MKELGTFRLIRRRLKGCPTEKSKTPEDKISYKTLMDDSPLNIRRNFLT